MGKSNKENKKKNQDNKISWFFFTKGGTCRYHLYHLFLSYSSVASRQLLYLRGAALRQASSLLVIAEDYVVDGGDVASVDGAVTILVAVDNGRAIIVENHHVKCSDVGSVAHTVAVNIASDTST